MNEFVLIPTEGGGVLLYQPPRHAGGHSLPYLANWYDTMLAPREPTLVPRLRSIRPYELPSIDAVVTERLIETLLERYAAHSRREPGLMDKLVQNFKDTFGMR